MTVSFTTSYANLMLYIVFSVKVLGESVWNLTEEQHKLLLPPLDPYDNPLVTPLLEFAKHPIAQELIHNGQAFQVLGITNYSHWGDAGDMRHCVWKDEGARQHLAEVALARIDKFIHVGVTPNRLSESVEAAAVRRETGVCAFCVCHFPMVFWLGCVTLCPEHAE